jgi:Gpi18-like mannosyltransferase
LRRLQSGQIHIFLLWAAWLVILVGFQSAIPKRFNLVKPDEVLSWTASLTPNEFDPLRDPILAEPFLGTQVSFDSKLYLSIAVYGYDDPHIPFVMPPHFSALPSNKPLSVNYAFFPLYPLLIRILTYPLALFGLNWIAAAILSGVIISALGALAAMLALYDLTRPELGQAGGFRSAFYLLIFPTGFFLAQVFSEGLFIGLAFACLALLRRKAWVWASLFAALAVMTRAVGLALILPFAWAWLKELDWKFSFRGVFNSTQLFHAALAALPLLVYLAWRFSYYGKAFDIVEREFFGQQLFAFKDAWQNWSQAFRLILRGRPAAAFYYTLEFSAILLAAVSILSIARRYPDVALFSLMVVLVPLTSGAPQSMVRYVLSAPAVYVFLSRLGRRPLFDRVWTIASLLLMTLLVILFTFDLWVA